MEYGILQFAHSAAAAFGTAMLYSVGGIAGALLTAIPVPPVLGAKESVPVVATAVRETFVGIGAACMLWKGVSG